MKKLLLLSGLLACAFNVCNGAYAFSDDYLAAPRPIYFNVLRKLILEQPHVFTTTRQGNALIKQAQFIKDEDTHYIVTLISHSDGSYSGTLIRRESNLTPVTIQLSQDQVLELLSLLENIQKTYII